MTAHITKPNGKERRSFGSFRDITSPISFLQPSINFSTAIQSRVWSKSIAPLVTTFPIYFYVFQNVLFLRNMLSFLFGDMTVCGLHALCYSGAKSLKAPMSSDKSLLVVSNSPLRLGKDRTFPAMKMSAQDTNECLHQLNKFKYGQPMA